MRQWKFEIAVLVFLGVGGCLTQGQNVPPPGGPPPRATPRRTWEGQGELRYLTQQLNLTPDQKEKLRPIITEQGDQLSAVRLDEHLPPDQKRSKMLEIRESFRPKISGVLTPEQLEKWKKLQPPAPAQGAESASAPPATAKPQ
jgi:periplasmic protein CpxP/Spy